MGSVIQMVATSTGGDESGLAAIDCPMNGHIVGVEWAGRTVIDTTLDRQTWQLSFGTTLNVVNDSRQVISNTSVGATTILTAVGAAVGVIDRYAQIPDIPVSMGERMFLHSSAAAGVVGTIFCTVHFDFDVDKPLARRR